MCLIIKEKTREQGLGKMLKVENKHEIEKVGVSNSISLSQKVSITNEVKLNFINIIFMLISLNTLLISMVGI